MRPQRMWVAGLLLFTLGRIHVWAQDTVVVVRNVNLRADPSSDNPPIRTLVPPDRLELLDPQPTNQYLHVKTDDDEEGWVYSRNVRVEPAAVVTPPGTSSAIDENWPKAAVADTTFSSNGKTCGPTGDGGDAETNHRKNRTDVPPSYHDVAFDAIANLPYPVAGKTRDTWDASELAEIGRFEGVPLRVVGYLVAIKPQNGGSGESTNCHWNQPAQVDWHVALVGEVGKGEKDAVVVETTPRIRKDHAKWTTARLQAWVDVSDPVRISGWLMLDPEHRNHLGKYRSTLWEIHPITKVEVWKAGAWVDLDVLP